ncbi:hypothetical protein COO60DRAFT_1528497 [Scenedesmus sp. NREL 46B-D3]|nr:hypothetical protein COO60DRAFT_1528497 [Scenedesmus sp. NREL 46B-D3]
MRVYVWRTLVQPLCSACCLLLMRCCTCRHDVRGGLGVSGGEQRLLQTHCVYALSKSCRAAVLVGVRKSILVCACVCSRVQYYCTWLHRTAQSAPNLISMPSVKWGCFLAARSLHKHINPTQASIHLLCSSSQPHRGCLVAHRSTAAVLAQKQVCMCYGWAITQRHACVHAAVLFWFGGTT